MAASFSAMPKPQFDNECGTNDEKSRSNVPFAESRSESEELGLGVLSKSSGMLGKIWQMLKAIDKYGVETRGIERVLPHEKKPPTTEQWLDNMWMWFAANCTTATLALGTLGPSTFSLSGKTCIVTIVLFNLLATIPVSFFSIFGAKLGIRQMTVSRFSFGYWVTLFPVTLNIFSSIGWSTVNTIGCVQVLRAVSHTLPTYACIIIVAALTVIAPFFGYKVVHIYERYAWIPVAIVFAITFGLNVKYMDMGSLTSATDVTSGVLGFGATIVGYGLSWSPLAAGGTPFQWHGTFSIQALDYTVHMDVNAPSWKIFILIYVGSNISFILIESLGAALATVIREGWQQKLNDEGIGGLLAISLSPAHGFGKFCVVLAAFSLVSTNILNMYSFPLSFQLFGKFAQKIPRILLILAGTAVYIVLSLIGAGNFQSWLDSLLVILSYWLSIYCTILFEEHFIFRKGKWSNYNIENYTDHKRLPLGLAAAISIAFGICGAVLGMATPWYTGVVGRKVGQPNLGGDIGFELSAAFTAISYSILRFIEIRYLEGPERMGKS